MLWTQSMHPVKPCGTVVVDDGRETRGRAQAGTAATGETKCSAQGLDVL